MISKLAVAAPAALFTVALGSAAAAQGFSVVGAGDRGGTSGNAATSGRVGNGDVTARGLAATGQSAVITPTGEIRRADGVRAVVEPRHPWEYGGISPGGTGGTSGSGSGNVPRWWTRAVRRNARSGRVVIAWPGFQLTPNGSRVFLAVSGAAQITPAPVPGRLVYRIRNALVPVYNNRRALETAAFETPVSRAYLRPRGRDVDLVIELRGTGEPQMTQSAVGEGLQFVYFEFGPWTPPATSSSDARTGTGSSSSSGSSRGSGAQQGIRPAAGSASQAQDDEAPPPVTR